MAFSTSCKQPKSVADQGVQEKEVFEKVDMQVNEFNSLIEGEIIARYKADERFNEVYQNHFSFADVKVLKVKRGGQNYHGQFDKGDTLRVFFSFSLEPTKGIFDDLYMDLPGLPEKAVFEAELKEKGGEPAYTVNLYQRIPTE